METVEQIIPCGRITGIKEDGVCRFLGIRYAKADRFSYPEEITEWKGVFDATQYGDAPLQKDAFDPVDCSDPKNFFAYETMNGVSLFGGLSESEYLGAGERRECTGIAFNFRWWRGNGPDARTPVRWNGACKEGRHCSVHQLSTQYLWFFGTACFGGA